MAMRTIIYEDSTRTQVLARYYSDKLLQPPCNAGIFIPIS